MIEKQPKKGLIEKARRWIAGGALGSFLFLSSVFPSKAEAQDPSTELENVLKLSSTVRVEQRINNTKYVKECRGNFETRKGTMEMTRRFNDIEEIREFINPGSPIGITDFFAATTISVPSRMDFGPLVMKKLRNLFEDGAEMEWCQNILELKKGDRYEIQKVVVVVRKQEEKAELAEFLKNILEKEAEKRGLASDIVSSILDRIGLRLTILASVEIKLYNLNTRQSLTLIGFGIPRKIGFYFTSIDRELAFREAINNAFDNLRDLLKEATGSSVVSGEVFIIAPEK